jgi:hypothetical protein
MFFPFGLKFGRLQFVEKSVEALEVALPQAAVLLQPDLQFLERRGPQGINAALRVHANAHQSSLAEHAEMFGDLRLTETQAMDQVADRPRSVQQ